FARRFPSPLASAAAGGLGNAAAAAWLHAGLRFLRWRASGISARARESARSRPAPIQPSTPFRGRHSAGERPEARLQLLPQARSREPLLSEDQFRGELPGVSFAPVRREKPGAENPARRRRSCPHFLADIAGAVRRLRAAKERQNERG